MQSKSPNSLESRISWRRRLSRKLFQVAKAVMDQGVSVAIFAPGWVLECNELEKFEENQEKFWGVLPVLR